MVSTSPARNAEGWEMSGGGEMTLIQINPALKMRMLINAAAVLFKLFIKTSPNGKEPDLRKPEGLIEHGNDAFAQFPKRGGRIGIELKRKFFK